MKTNPVAGEGYRPRQDRYRKNPTVYAVNHASAMDIPVLYVYLPFQFRIVFKKELLSYPVVDGS